MKQVLQVIGEYQRTICGLADLDYNTTRELIEGGEAEKVVGEYKHVSKDLMINVT